MSLAELAEDGKQFSAEAAKVLKKNVAMHGKDA
jgi:hypothetical protein